MRLLKVFGILQLLAVMAVGLIQARSACASDETISGSSARHILPPLGSAIDLLPAPKRDAAAPVLAKAVETAKPQSDSSDQIPAADTPSVEDDVSDSVAENAVVPQVEEDSAAGLNDLGDVGGDFEE